MGARGARRVVRRTASQSCARSFSIVTCDASRWHSLRRGRRLPSECTTACRALTGRSHPVLAAQGRICGQRLAACLLLLQPSRRVVPGSGRLFKAASILRMLMQWRIGDAEENLSLMPNVGDAVSVRDGNSWHRSADFSWCSSTATGCGACRPEEQSRPLTVPNSCGFTCHDVDVGEE
jgi:hypothetical protein